MFAISWHFERDPIPYALEGAGGFEPLHLKIKFANPLLLLNQRTDLRLVQATVAA